MSDLSESLQKNVGLSGIVYLRILSVSMENQDSNDEHFAIWRNIAIFPILQEQIILNEIPGAYF